MLTAPPKISAIEVPVPRSAQTPFYQREPDGEENKENRDIIYEESWYATLFQILIPFLLASLGTIIAGVVLGNVETWTVYKHINELFILVPGLCGLKGNLDMCVAARLCTQSALGNLRKGVDTRKIIIGNLAVVQVQAIVCSILLSTFTVVLRSIMASKLLFQNYVTLVAASVITASTSCAILDTMLVFLILFSQRYRFNPDYMATPIVASIGDVTSISMLSYSAAVLHGLSSKFWICLVIIALYVMILLPFMIAIAFNNAYTRPVLIYGWISVIGAAAISEFCGLVLSTSVEQYSGFAVYSPIINGSGGNLVSVQTNYMTTMLFRHSVLGKLPKGTRICEAPYRVLFWGTIYARVSRIVVAITIPCNIMQAYLADYVYTLNVTVHVIFIVAFVVACVLQLIILLNMAHLLVHTLWHFKIDPDSAAIPYLTAFGDCLGTGLLYIMFYLLRGTQYAYNPLRSAWM